MMDQASNPMSAPNDDLDAVRTVVEAIKDFKPDEQQRIFRWVAEKLGLPQPFGSSVHTPPLAPIATGTSPHAAAHQPPVSGGIDIKSFITNKKPRSDVQFAAAVAYYYRFEALQTERKDAINKDDLQEATRKVNRDRLVNPLKTLQNAHQLGMLDKGSERATFTINSVGENLVAMALPGDGANNAKARKPAQKPGKSATNVASKKLAKKA
jgi:hypothetical protein